MCWSKFFVYLSMFLLTAAVVGAQTEIPSDQKPSSGTQSPVVGPESTPAPNPLKQQPKRILGVMPNYRAVSAGAIPPPPTPREAFKIATRQTFDYSSFVFVGITSAMAWGIEWPHAAPSHPKLGSGIVGFSRYYWRGFVDKADGNYLVVFALPTLLHEDERYYAKGEGRWFKRAIYAASRILITPNYQGHNTFNAAEIFGRGMAQAASLSYYPSADRNGGALAVKYGYALGRDALTNVFREFWPDINAHLLHRHKRSD